jgi:hypothetical protein
VSPVCGAECVVHVNIGEAPQRRCKLGIVFLFFGVETQVFE